MKVTFELTPIELEAAIKDGTIVQLLHHATSTEKIAERAALEQMTSAPAATVTQMPGVPAPGIQMPGSNLPPAIQAPASAAPEFNPTIAAPAAPAAVFDPMALPGIPAPAAIPAPIPPAPITPAPLTPAPMNPAPVAPGTAAPTIDQVRATLAPLIKAGKEAQMQKLFSDFGASKLTDIPADKYGELITQAAAL